MLTEAQAWRLLAWAWRHARYNRFGVTYVTAVDGEPASGLCGSVYALGKRERVTGSVLTAMMDAICTRKGFGVPVTAPHIQRRAIPNECTPCPRIAIACIGTGRAANAHAR